MTDIVKTIKQLVIDLLMKGPQTRTSLAKAVISKGLSKNKDINLVKSYVSVILSNLKRQGMKIITSEPGSYSIKK